MSLDALATSAVPSGNSRAIAQKHYLQVTDDHFTVAAKDPDEMVKPIDKEAGEKAAQNPAQQMHADSRNASQDENPEMKNPAICGVFLDLATPCGEWS